jgi:hypothetical protein
VYCAPASKPGGDLLFHCLSNSTIGAVWFHGRVRDGIGWVTDAMATKLWGRRVYTGVLEIEFMLSVISVASCDVAFSALSVMAGLSSANRAISTG